MLILIFNYFYLIFLFQLVMNKQSRKDLLYDLYAISDFGTSQGILEDIEKIENDESVTWEKKMNKKPKTANCKKRRNRQGFIVVPDIEFLDENDKKNTEEIAHNKYHNFPKEIPISFDERRKELDEIGSAVFRNESIEHFIKNCLKENTELLYDEKNLKDNKNQIAATSPNQETKEETSSVLESNSSTNKTIVQSKKSKKRPKSKNVLLNSLKNLNKEKSSQSEIKKIGKNELKSSSPKYESIAIKDFYVDSSVDKLSIDDNTLLNIVSECQGDSTEIINIVDYSSISNEQSEDDFFSASEFDSTSSSEYITASSNKMIPVDVKEYRKKRYHSTSRRGLQFNDSCISFQSKPVKKNLPENNSKVENNIYKSKSKDDDYTYTSEIIKCDYSYDIKEFPPLNSRKFN